jgi:hypothetical protein
LQTEQVPANEQKCRGQDKRPQAEEEDRKTVEVLAVGEGKSEDMPARVDNENGERQVRSAEDAEAATKASEGQLNVSAAPPASYSVGTGKAMEGKDTFTGGNHSIRETDHEGGRAVENPPADSSSRSESVKDAPGSTSVAEIEKSLEDSSIGKHVQTTSNL